MQPPRYKPDGVVYYAYSDLETETKKVMTRKESDFIHDSVAEVQHHDEVLWAYLCEPVKVR